MSALAFAAGALLMSCSASAANVDQLHGPNCGGAKSESPKWLWELTNPQALARADKSQIRLAKNEIFARHGYRFSSKDLKDHFSKQSWYHEDAKFDPATLSIEEQDAVAKLRMFEELIYLGDSEQSELGQGTKPVEVDLNGDGKAERVWLTPNPEHPTYRESILHIGSTETLLTGTFYVVTLNQQTKLRAVALSDQANGATTDFYRWTGKSLEHMGQVGGLIVDSVIILPDGRIKSETTTRFLGLWSHPQEYRVDSAFKVVAIDQDYYPMNLGVTAKVRFSLRKSPTDSSKAFDVSPGQALTLVATDKRSWVLAENTKCERGWFEVRGKDTIVSLNQRDVDVLDGILIGD